MLFPHRFGAQSVWLGEAELADAYRNRFDAAGEQETRLNAVHHEGVRMLWAPGTAWLAASLVPDVPGSMRLTNSALDAVSSWGMRLSQELFASPNFASVAINNRAVGFRRILLSVDHVTATSTVRYNYAQLHPDRAGLAAAELLRLSPEEGDVQIVLGELAAELLSMLVILTRHAVDNTGVSGDGIFQVELVEPDRGLVRVGPATRDELVRMNRQSPIHMGRKMRLYEEPTPPSRDRRRVFHTVELENLPPVRHTIPIDAVATDATELLGAARLALADLASGFGLAEPPQFTVDGRVNLHAFGHLRDAARVWSERNALAVT